MIKSVSLYSDYNVEDGVQLVKALLAFCIASASHRTIRIGLNDSYCSLQSSECWLDCSMGQVSYYKEWSRRADMIMDATGDDLNEGKSCHLSSPTSSTGYLWLNASLVRAALATIFCSQSGSWVFWCRSNTLMSPSSVTAAKMVADWGDQATSPTGLPRAKDISACTYSFVFKTDRSNLNCGSFVFYLLPETHHPSWDTPLSTW